MPGRAYRRLWSLFFPHGKTCQSDTDNKMFAKLGSDMKKLAAITEIRKDEFKEKI